ncbi:MAG TPA: glycine cleavage T C-terminal barrel domain-containing protein, partial [Candidatus Hydrogenedentes bacterium]|nr:glycine cleavage T C-terminal barrel domain-containing protein [Candidatus Hydrogenedentota bacterium]
LTAAAALSYFGLTQAEWSGYPVLLSRTGYTGELGYELYLPNAAAVPLWRRLLDHPAVAPAGLGARDTLRLEMGYLLSGQDIDGSRTPLEARQDAFIDWNKPFTGREALEKQRDAGGYSVLTPIWTDSRSAPRHGFDVYRGDETVGVVTSGTYGPSVERGIGLAYLSPELAEPGVTLTAGPRRIAIEVTEIPFYGAGTCRN